MSGDTRAAYRSAKAEFTTPPTLREFRISPERLEQVYNMNPDILEEDNTIKLLVKTVGIKWITLEWIAPDGQSDDNAETKIDLLQAYEDVVPNAVEHVAPAPRHRRGPPAPRGFGGGAAATTSARGGAPAAASATSATPVAPAASGVDPPDPPPPTPPGGQGVHFVENDCICRFGIG